MAHRLFYFNALFDLELGGYALSSAAAAARGMAVLFAFLGDRDDRVLLDADIKDDYWEYLSRCGIVVCRPLGRDENAHAYHAVPWGWNERCVARLAACGARCRFPDLSSVKKVNSRSFCSAFNRESTTGVPGSRFCTSGEEVREAFAALAGAFPIVAKPDFGASGFGFIHITAGAEPSVPLARSIERLLSSGGCTVEPWCDRLCDVSTSCSIKNDGTIHDLRHYRCHTASHGAFYAVSVGGNDPFIDRYHDDLERAALLAAHALSKLGYFGPVGFDSFVYRDATSGIDRLAPVIEINARHVMSSIAHALHEKIGSGRRGFLRLLSRRFCTLPDSYKVWETVLGNDCYDPNERKGIILLTPLRVSHAAGWSPPSRNVFFIVAQNEEEVAAMDGRLREALMA